MAEPENFIIPLLRELRTDERIVALERKMRDLESN